MIYVREKFTRESSRTIRDQLAKLSLQCTVHYDIIPILVKSFVNVVVLFHVLFYIVDVCLSSSVASIHVFHDAS